MAQIVKPEDLRSALAAAVSDLKSYEVPDECVRLGLAAGDEAEAFGSKYRYVMKRLRPLDIRQLMETARKFLDQYRSEPLEEVLGSFGMKGADGEFKNLIFAANGPKPKMVLLDAVINKLEIIENSQYCLTYTRPLSPGGLSWADLVDWWMADHCPRGTDRATASNGLQERLHASLAPDSPPERTLFETYARLYSFEGGFEVPALIPQVYLHYDPYVSSFRRTPGPLARQRMDFLLLLPQGQRIVIEVDGVQHYAEDKGKTPSPKRYSDMVAEDRRLKLTGYEIYRFGGHELTEPGAGHLIADFFRQLFSQNHIPLPAGLT